MTGYLYKYVDTYILKNEKKKKKKKKKKQHKSAGSRCCKPKEGVARTSANLAQLQSTTDMPEKKRVECREDAPIETDELTGS